MKEYMEFLLGGIQKIKTLPEVVITDPIKSLLTELEGFEEIYRSTISYYSPTKKNMTIIPSQYLLLALYLKPFVGSLNTVLDLHEEIKEKFNLDYLKFIRDNTNKNYSISYENKNEICAFVKSKVIRECDFDYFFKFICINTERLNARAFVDSEGFRSDVFESIILSCVNLPNANSAFLGDFIKILSCKEELYQSIFLEYCSHLPFFGNCAALNHFVFYTLKTIFEFSGIDDFHSCLVQYGDSDNFSIIVGDKKLTTIVQRYKNLPDSEGVKNGKKESRFLVPLYKKEDYYYLLSTEWSGTGVQGLDFANFQEFLKIQIPRFYTKQLTDESYSLFCEDSSSGRDKGLCTSPFLILAGISGTGKSRFVRTQAALSNGWGPNDPRKADNYELIPVRPDWHEPSDMLGYVSRISGAVYVPTDFLRFIVKAWQEVFNNGGSLNSIGEGTRPFWLCLDEMNLAPVEQYFADYLAVLETRKWTGDSYSSLPLISGDLELIMKSLNASIEEPIWDTFIKREGIPIPPNLIVAGTVNMDETTHQFSRKVLDRAMTIDFNEFFPNDFNNYFDDPATPKVLGYPTSTDVSRGELEEIETKCGVDKDAGTISFLQSLNSVLKETPFELAYRAMTQLLLLTKQNNPKDKPTLLSVWDDFVMMKLLPRIEGDIDKLSCKKYDFKSQKEIDEESDVLQNLKTVLENVLIDIKDGGRVDLLRDVPDGDDSKKLKCRSLHKLNWMIKRLKNGYTSFWP